ncbi:hypothetical protein EJ04DRAFT_511839 [Polyplosphaeria fusca]|uniref:Uncharacterized protein n=1 Tax=Polyplosphaeria fusca TaxID=682080 RepID=A0A9P4QWL4_9PLEO|nr:hypothetical protein EJ04DRAFT_511839 [Polyplosphaeria fusca]
MNPQVGSYITNFLQKGFPHAGINRRTPENQRDPTYANTAYQQGLNDVGTNLKDGTAIIVHPRKYELGDDDAYHLGDGPQHGKPLGKVREAADKAMAKFGSQLTFLEDFLYVPNREQNNLGSYTGRTLVEYDPHYEIQPGVFRRMVMVLLENGGPRGAQNDDGTYEPGPGGPFFFDFGP